MTATEFRTHSVTHPRIHFLHCTHVSIISAEIAHHERLSVTAVGASIFEPGFMVVRCDPRQYVAYSFTCRSDAAPKEVNAAKATMETMHTLSP